MLRNDEKSCVLEIFLGLGGNSRDDAKEVERSIVWMSRFNAWVTMAVRYLTKLETLGCGTQKLYADKQGNLLKLVVKLLTEVVRVSVQHGAENELIYGHGRVMNYLVEVPLSDEKYLGVDGTTFGIRSAMS